MSGIGDAIAHHQAGRLAQAESLYLELLKRNPNDARGAELAYQNATQLKPDYTEAWYNLGNLLRGQQRNDAAAECYQRVIELKPRFPGAYENIALMMKRMGREDLAANVYRQWLA